MTTVTVGERFQVVIPKEIRERVGLKKHSKMQVALEGDQIVMRVPRVSALRGIGGAVADGTDATEYVQRLRSEWTARDRS
jgi:AbrB family looped-hinge helix DNA binding protein